MDPEDWALVFSAGYDAVMMAGSRAPAHELLAAALKAMEEKSWAIFEEYCDKTAP